MGIKIGTGIIGGNNKGIKGNVENFSDLPDVGINDGKTFLVKKTTGIIGFRKLSGLYLSNGTNWKRIGENQLKATDSDLLGGENKDYFSPATHTHMFKNVSRFISGRVYCYDDNRWISLADDYYGINYVNHTETAGTGINPVYEWENNGLILKQGTKLNKINIIGRANNSEITDLEIKIVIKKDGINHYKTDGVNSDSDLINDIIWEGTYMENGWTNMNYAHFKEIDLGGIIVDNNCSINMFIKPIGELTSTRYYMFSSTMEIEI